MIGLAREGCTGTNEEVYRYTFVSVREVRQSKNRRVMRDAAEGSAYGDMSVSLCGINPVIAEPLCGAREEKKKIIIKGGDEKEKK